MAGSLSLQSFSAPYKRQSKCNLLLYMSLIHRNAFISEATQAFVFWKRVKRVVVEVEVAWWSLRDVCSHAAFTDPF